MDQVKRSIEILESRIAANRFSRKFIIKPCIYIVCIMSVYSLMVASGYHWYWLLLVILNGLSLVIHNKFHDLLVSELEILKESEQKAKVRELNPFRK